MLDTLERQTGLSRKRLNMLILYMTKNPKRYKERRGKSLYYDERVGEVIKARSQKKKRQTLLELKAHFVNLVYVKI